MTQNEAVERAGKIWGAHRVVVVEVGDDGWADVRLKPFRPSWPADRGVLERTFTYHRLDANGHVVCHAACRTLEP